MEINQLHNNTQCLELAQQNKEIAAKYGINLDTLPQCPESEQPQAEAETPEEAGS